MPKRFNINKKGVTCILSIMCVLKEPSFVMTRGVSIFVIVEKIRIASGAKIIA